MSRAAESRKTVQEAQARHQAAVEQVQCTQEACRRVLIEKVFREDAPPKIELCHSAIDLAAEQRKTAIEVELGSFDGDHERDQEYPWDALRQGVTHLLRAEGYTVTDASHYEEVDGSGMGGATHVRIRIEW